MARVDLHLHTTLSDGRLTPTELVRLAVSRGVTVAAVTDHDSTEGLAEAFAEAAHHPELTLVPGIELSADHPTGEGDLHILGYFLDTGNRRLQGRLREFREGRKGRAQRMVERLAELGLPVEWSRVKEIAGEGSIGRPHIALAMVERGYIATPQEAFVEYLKDGGAAYVDRMKLPPEEAVELIQGAGGVAVLAHPIYVTGLQELLPHLVEAGIRGMEVHYANFNREQRREMGRTAQSSGLLPCGGSDYHGFGTPGEQLPGSAGPPMEVYRRLEKLASARASTP